MTGRGRARALRGVVTLGAVATLAGCGGGQQGASPAGGGTEPGARQAVTVHVGSLPIAADAPLFVGIKQGIFAKHGLHVVPRGAAGGSVIVAATVSGSDQFGFSDVVSTLTAVRRGLPLKIVGMGSQGGAKPSDAYSCLDVRGDSDIRTPADLEGKTISVNVLKNIVSLTPNAALANRGVNVSTLKFTEIDIPEEPAALAQKRVDAVSVTEPFCTVLRKQGARTILHPFLDTKPNLMVAAWITSGSYAQSHPDVVKRFAAAMSEANTYSQAHPDVVRKTILGYSKIPAEVAKIMKLPSWSPTVDRPSISLLDRLSQRFGIYHGSVDISKLVTG